MASRSETVTIARALLALITAVDEMDDALVKLARDKDEQLQEDINQSLIASREARTQCLEYIQKFLILVDQHHG